VLAALRYELVLTGPRGELLERTVTGGESFSLAVNLGEWRIDTKAYQDTALAGTGSVTLAVGPGSNSAQVPMNMSGKCYEIILNSYNESVGTVQSNFTAAFAGTSITIRAVEGPDGVFTDNTLEAEESGTSNPVANGPGMAHTFTMPASDVEVTAEFGQVVWYVRAGGAGTKDGTSWANASDDLQEMMDYLEGYTGLTKPCVVKMGAGTYRPQHLPVIPALPGSYTPGGSDAAFILRNGVQVWGGYPAGGGDSRNVTANVTTLSGDLDGDNSFSSADAYHVVLGVNIPAASGTVLDGLTITGGNAVGTSNIMAGISITQEYGGGMRNHNSSPVLKNVTISGNRADVAGGMYNTNSSPVLINAAISGNTAAVGSGGGMRNDGSSPVLINTTVSGNTAATQGGGMYGSSLALINVLISGNTANYGGGMHNTGSPSPMLINVTIAGNTVVTQGGGIYNAGSNLVISNSIIWGNTASGGGPSISNLGVTPTIAYSIVEGIVGNAPLFITTSIPPAPATGGNYRLNSGSPAIGQGLNASYPADANDSIFPAGLSDEAKAAINAALSRDLGGNVRKQGTNIDMGAYERQ
jgi:hypothetical protein